MATEYSRAVLRVAIAQLAQQLGWNAIQGSPMELLTDVVERYILGLGKTTHRYSEQFGRTEPNLDDLGLAFQDHSILLSELEDYVHQVDPVPFAKKVPAYPRPLETQLRFPKANSRELAEREEHVDDHFPPMNEEWDNEIPSELDKSNASSIGMGGSNGTGIYPTPGDPTRSSPVAVGEKRPFTSPEAVPAAKKQKILPDEAGHSQYQMKGIVMSDTGFLTPVRVGKLADAKTPPVKLMSQSSIQSEASVSSPPIAVESEGSPGSSPAPLASSIISETVNQSTSYGQVEEIDVGSNKPDLVLVGTEDINQPVKEKPVVSKDKINTKVKSIKEKKKLKGVLTKDKLNKLGKKKKFKKHVALKKPETFEEMFGKAEDIKAVTKVTVPEKKIKKKKKLKAKPPLTIETKTVKPSPDLKENESSTVFKKESKTEKSVKKKKNQKGKGFKSPRITVLSPVSPRGPKSPRSPRSPRPQKSPKKSPGRMSPARVPKSSARSPVKSPLKSPKVGKTKKLKDKKSPGRPKKEVKPQKASKASKATKEVPKSVEVVKEIEPVVEEPDVKVEKSAVIEKEPETVIKSTEEPEVVDIQPLPMDTIPAQTPSPAPTEAAEHEPNLSPYQEMLESPEPKEEPAESLSDIPDLSKDEEELEIEVGKPPTPKLEITSVQSIPLSSYETDNGTAAALSDPPISEVSQGESSKFSSWQGLPPTPGRRTSTDIHFSASDDDGDNDFSFITESIQAKIDKDDEFTDDDFGDKNSPEKILDIPSIPIMSSPTKPAVKSPVTSPESPTKRRGRPPKKDKLKIKIGEPKPGSVKEILQQKLKKKGNDKDSTKLLKPEAELKDDYDLPSAERAGLSITTPTSPPFSSLGQPSVLSPVTLKLAPIKISTGGRQFSIKPMAERKEDGKPDDKEKKKDKKKKKNKDKDKDKEKEKDKDKSKEERKKEKSEKKKEKKLKKEKKDDTQPSIPKLTFKFGGGNSTSVSVSSPAKQETKQEPTIPKLLIKSIPSPKPSPKASPRPSTPATAGFSPCPTHSPVRSLANSPAYVHSPLRPTSPSPSPSNSPLPRTPSPTPGPRRSMSISPSPMSPLSSVLRSPSPPSSRSPSPTVSRFASSLPPPPPSSKDLASGIGPPPPSSSSSKGGVASTAAATLSVKKGSRAIITETQGKIYDEKGDIIWICPSCKMPDDGSPMIGCDTCDDWYHWTCMKITEEPGEAEWFCPRCSLRNQGEEKKKRGRKPKGAGRGRGKKKHPMF